MSSRTYNTSIIQGETWHRVLTYTNDDGGPVNLTGADVEMHIRKNPNSDIVAELKASNGRVSLSGTSGKITLTLPYQITADIPAGKYVYDLRLNNAVLMRGNFIVEAAVTKD